MTEIPETTLEEWADVLRVLTARYPSDEVLHRLEVEVTDQVVDGP